MPRATRVLPAATGDVADAVILAPDQRQARRGHLIGVNGTEFELDLAEPVTLRMGDVLVLEDGRLVEVLIAAEPLFEARADVTTLARLAWRLGDRHEPVEILPNRLRVRQSAAIEALLKAEGVKVAAIEAPFNPEGGAYATPDRAQADRHAHDHDHHGHRHDHDHGHDHDRPGGHRRG